MPHVFYDINTRAGIFDQTGEGSYDGPYFRGTLFQRGYGRQRQVGYGVVSLMKKAWRYLKPYAQKYAAPLAKQALGAVTKTGGEAVANFIQDVVQGEDPKTALVTRSTEAAKALSRQAGEKLTQMGSGTRKRKGAIKKPSLANLHLVGRSVLESAAKRRNLGSGLGLTL